MAGRKICQVYPFSPTLPMDLHRTRWHVAASPTDWLARALDFVSKAEREAMAARGVFHIVLAGGGTPKQLYQALAGETHDWARWRVWFGDERCLAPDDPERNSAMARQVWLDRVPLPAANIHLIPAELGPDAAAARYARTLEAVDRFDLTLLGLGEDGHTASLFPRHDWGDSENSPPAIPVFDAPKPPLRRVSLSALRLSRSDRVLFLLAGPGKREPVRRWLAGERIPAAAIRPDQGVDVLLDHAASPGDPAC